MPIYVTRSVVGSRYTPPNAGQRALLLANTLYNAWLRLAGPDMSTLPASEVTALDRVVTWSATNLIVYYGPEKAVMTFVPSTGLLTGTYTDTPNGIKLPFGGAVSQKQGLLTGRYTIAGGSGFFSITPR